MSIWFCLIKLFLSDFILVKKTNLFFLQIVKIGGQNSTPEESEVKKDTDEQTMLDQVIASESSSISIEDDNLIEGTQSKKAALKIKQIDLNKSFKNFSHIFKGKLATFIR